MLSLKKKTAIYHCLDKSQLCESSALFEEKKEMSTKLKTNEEIKNVYAALAADFKKVEREMFSLRLRAVLLQIRQIKKPDRHMRELISRIEMAISAPVRNDRKLADLMDEFWDMV